MCHLWGITLLQLLLENPFKLTSEIYTALALKERDLVNLISKDIEEPIKRNYETHASKIQVPNRSIRTLDLTLFVIIESRQVLY